MEIEHGDRNYRLHRGSHNQHIDEGNYNRVVNEGWEHLHIDEGHHFVEIGGAGSAYWNSFETSSTHEEVGNPDHCENQHGPGFIRAQDGHGADKRGCDAKFAAWPWVGENDCGNQFFLLHKGSQIFRLVEGHQHFHLFNGHQKFHLLNGHQTFHLENGDQLFQLDSGDMERWVNGKRLTYYAKECIEATSQHWYYKAATWIKLKAPTIVLDGNVLIKKNLQVKKWAKVDEGVDSPGITGAAASAPTGPGFGGKGEKVPDMDDTNPQISQRGC
mgnify:CR=1 FL=1